RGRPTALRYHARDRRRLRPLRRLRLHPRADRRACADAAGADGAAARALGRPARGDRDGADAPHSRDRAMSDDLCFASLSALAAQIAARRVSAVEVTRAVLARIERVGGALNCYITVNAEQALAQARALDALHAAGTSLGPLHGVPIALKDNIQTAGLRTTVGSEIYADWVPDADATVAARLRSAGAILIGKNNLYEFAFGAPHPRYGPVHNPWDTARSCAGSSSGSGSAVAAGLAYGALGTDTGGSVRLPAAYCGVVGLKPTYGRVSRAGVVPVSYNLDHVGPLTRGVRDAALVLAA